MASERSMRRHATLAITLVLCASALVAAGLAYAKSQASGQISACVDPNTGVLSITSKCPGTTLTWNIQGPAGPPGQLSTSAAAAIESELAGIQSQLKILHGAIAAIHSGEQQQRTAFLQLRRRFAAASSVAARITDLGEMSDQTSLALQKAMDRQSKLLTTLSNLEKKLADTDSTLEQNLK